MLNAATDMLYHLGHKNHADAIRESVWATVCEDKIVTPGKIELALLTIRICSCSSECTLFTDLGGNHTSTDVVQNVLKRLSEKDIIW